MLSKEFSNLGIKYSAINKSCFIALYLKLSSYWGCLKFCPETRTNSECLSYS